MNPKQQALLVIDVQNDYFDGGKFPLWNSEATLVKIEAAIAQAQAREMPVILIQHIADASKGPAPFFNPGSEGVALHPRLLAAAPDAPIVIKQHADSFVGTTLAATLQALGVKELLVCGMMTQNCVVFTAISPQAQGYEVSILPDCCTTVSEMLHRIALAGVATRMTLAAGF